AESAPPAAKPKLDEDLLNLLAAAIKASKRDERGYASLSEVAQRAGNRSSFDARNYGFSRLSELIQAIPNFTTEKREGGSIFVKRLR
ncbi:MAG: OST-HTH/LOTUS domain-containing protein, partial [Gammaproteobacteria bacterium]